MTNAVKAALVAALVFLLSGCFMVEMDMTVSSDDKVSGSMTLALEEQAVSALGELDPEGGSLIDVDDLPPGATSEPYEQDGYIGRTVTFADVPLEEFNDSMQQDGGTFTIVREGDKFVLTGTIELTGDTETTDSAAPSGFEEAITQALASGSMTLSVTFPGEVTDTNGAVSGTTVTWVLADLLDDPEMYATADADEAASVDEETAAESSAADDGSSSFPVWPVMLGVAAAVLMIGGAAYLITYRRKA